MSKPLPIYLDYAATTPIDPRVAESMIACLRDPALQGNPSSMNHDYGRRARAVVEKGRGQVAAAIGAPSPSILFTSGATESNNLALFGAARFHCDRGKHIVSSRTEHKAVLDALKQLEAEGFDVTYLKPGAAGIVEPAQLSAALRPDTILVSLMHVNNEIGVVQDIAAFGEICRERNVLLHVDAAQSLGKVPLDVQAAKVDLLSLTAHKVYGPKGIGALYVRRTPPIGMRPILFGGGQEQGLRSGTLSTHQIVGMGLACELAQRELEADVARIKVLREKLWDGIAKCGHVQLNGDAHRRVCSVLNVSFEAVEGESLQFALSRLAVSSGSACATASDSPSYVLRALGRTDQLAQSSIRFSLGRFTTEAEIDAAIAAIGEEVPRLRALTPS